MEVLNKYLDGVRDELNSGRKNLDRTIDLFKSSVELYSHSQQNLINVMLYPESSMSLKYPSDWYKPTATFRLTETYTVQPKDGLFFLSFFPNLLYEKRDGKSALEILTGGQLDITKSSSLGKFFNDANGAKSLLDKYTGDLAGKIASFANDRGLGDAMNLLNKDSPLWNAISEFSKRKLKAKIKGDDMRDGKTDDGTAFEKITNFKDELEDVLEKTGVLSHFSSAGSTTANDSTRLCVQDNIIEQYRCNAAVVKVRGEDSSGVLMGTTTYFNTKDLENQRNRYMNNFSNFAQEWINKIEDNPENGIRAVKIPKDNSDTQFRIPNTIGNVEQVILFGGKGLNPNSILLIDVIQHIEFIPKLEMMDFFTPTIPMFTLGSKDMLYKTVSNFPIIGANGGLVINSPKKMDGIMEYLKKYKESGTSMTLWNVLSDSSYIDDAGFKSLVNETFYN